MHFYLTNLFFLFLVVQSFLEFNLIMPVPHRTGNVNYTSSLPTTLNRNFDFYERLDKVSHVTTIENALFITKSGLSLSLINDYSVVSRGILDNESTHPLRFIPVIWLSPSVNDPVQVSRYGNVAFSTNFNSLFSNNVNQQNLQHKFYIIEFVQYVKVKVVRILITKNEYPLHKFSPLDSTSPIYFNITETKWYFAKTYNKQSVEVEIITDFIVPLPFISYASAPERRVKVENGEICGYFPIFIDDAVGYLFYCIFKNSISANSQYSDITKNGLYYNELVRRLGQLNLGEYVNYDNVEVNQSQNPDDIVEKLLFPRVFSFPVGNRDYEDYGSVQQLYMLFCMYGKVPSLRVCLNKFFIAVNRFVQLRYGQQKFEHLMGVFLSHFCKKEGEIIKADIQQFVVELHKPPDPQIPISL